jgi:hypothetical protein
LPCQQSTRDRACRSHRRRRRCCRLHPRPHPRVSRSATYIRLGPLMMPFPGKAPLHVLSDHAVQRCSHTHMHRMTSQERVVLRRNRRTSGRKRMGHSSRRRARGRRKRVIVSPLARRRAEGIDNSRLRHWGRRWRGSCTIAAHLTWHATAHLTWHAAAHTAAHAAAHPATEAREGIRSCRRRCRCRCRC